MQRKRREVNSMQPANKLGKRSSSSKREEEEKKKERAAKGSRRQAQAQEKPTERTNPTE
jgi:hypothetical protein